jgi:FkbM family methyltransferase
VSELEVGPYPSRLVGIARRLRWRAHWAVRPNEPFVVRSWWQEMSLRLPRSGSAATAYYRTFPSRTIAEWIVGGLRPGAVALDVGAHVGVYTFVAAYCVGPSGVVHAVEPQQDMLSMLEQNARTNGMTNVRAHCMAFGESDVTIGLNVDPRSRGAFTTPAAQSDAPTVRMTRLESFATAERLGRVALMKVDAAGDELGVLLGARSFLAEIDRIVCKLYHPSVVAQRFHERRAPEATVDYLRALGYSVVLADGRPATGPALRHAFDGGAYSVPALATRSGEPVG